MFDVAKDDLKAKGAFGGGTPVLKVLGAFHARKNTFVMNTSHIEGVRRASRA